MTGMDWVGPAITVIFVVGAALAVFRRATVRGNFGKGASAASLVLLAAMVIAVGVAGYLFWKRQVSEAMAPEK